ncbi:hypothetical protein KDL45_11390 [bacterium]|nr:hypothetical protein [bacterium]
MAEFVVEKITRLAASANEVWAHATRMDGVNAELMPLVRMTYPAEAKSLSIADAPTGEFLFNSLLLAFGVLPFDVHRLRLAHVGPGRSFREDSTTWLQRRWQHERWVEDDGAGCTVRDRVTVTPRLGFTTPMVRGIVRFVFAHRHRRLAARFGAEVAPRSPARHETPAP